MKNNNFMNIKQSILHKSDLCTISYNNFNLQLIKFFFKNGLINHYKKIFKNNKFYIKIFLNSYENKCIIKDINTIKSTRQLFKNKLKIKNYVLINTSKGFF